MKNMKTASFLITSTLVAGLALTGCGSSPSAKTDSSSSATKGSSDTKADSSGSASDKKPVVLRLADNQSPDYPTVAGDNEFAKLVKERTNGRIEIKVYPSAQLGDEKSVIEQIQLGAIDFGRINTAPLAEFDKQIGVFNLPYLFKSSDQMWNVLNGPVGDKILKSLEGSKMEGLTYYDSGSRNFYDSKKPI